jgi:hypothetical protein
MIIYSVLFSYIFVQNINEQNGKDFSFSLRSDLWIGIVGIIIVLIFLIQKKKYWVHALSLLILVTITPLVSFSNFSLYIGAGIFSFDLVVIVLLILHLSLNPDARAPISKLLQETSEEKESRLKKEKIEFEQAVKRYKEKYESYSKDRLREIIDKNQHVAEAIQAARELVSKNE